MFSNPVKHRVLGAKQNGSGAKKPAERRHSRLQEAGNHIFCSFTTIIIQMVCSIHVWRVYVSSWLHEYAVISRVFVCVCGEREREREREVVRESRGFAIVDMHMHMHIHAYIYTRAHTRIDWGLPIRLEWSTGICTYTCTHTHTYMHTCIYTCRLGSASPSWMISLKSTTSTCMWICIYICTYTYTHRLGSASPSWMILLKSTTSTCMCIYIYIYTHTHTYTHRLGSASPSWMILLKSTTLSIPPFTLWIRCCTKLSAMRRSSTSILSSIVSHMCVCIYVYTYIYIYMCVCMYIYIYIYLYTHIHTYPTHPRIFVQRTYVHTHINICTSCTNLHIPNTSKQQRYITHTHTNLHISHASTHASQWHTRRCQAYTHIYNHTHTQWHARRWKAYTHTSHTYSGIHAGSKLIKFILI